MQSKIKKKLLQCIEYPNPNVWFNIINEKVSKQLFDNAIIEMSMQMYCNN